MSLLGSLPSENRRNFAQVERKPSSTTGKVKPSTKAPAVYTATHDTAPPAHQVISTEKTDLLFRKLLQKQETGGHKREAAEDKEETQPTRRVKQLKTASRGKERARKATEDDEQDIDVDEAEAEREKEEAEEEEEEESETVAAEEDEAEAEEEEEAEPEDTKTKNKTKNKNKNKKKKEKKTPTTSGRRQNKSTTRASTSRKRRKMDE